MHLGGESIAMHGDGKLQSGPETFEVGERDDVRQVCNCATQRQGSFDHGMYKARRSARSVEQLEHSGSFALACGFLGLWPDGPLLQL